VLKGHAHLRTVDACPFAAPVYGLPNDDSTRKNSVSSAAGHASVIRAPL
jgi:hypothetical protein